MAARGSAPKRNKGFDATHDELLKASIGLIAARGIEALSISELARAAGVNRTTVYYHFASREALVAAVKHWSAEQLVRAFNPDLPQQERIDYVVRFVLDHPELITLWIEDFTSPGDIRDSYPFWDALVEGIAERFAQRPEAERIDAEIYCVNLLASAIIGPRIYRNSVRPDAPSGEIVERFRRERQRVLARDGLLRE